MRKDRAWLRALFLGKVVRVVVDRQMGSLHPQHGFVYPVNYGYVPGTVSGDGEEIDAYILSVFAAVPEFVGECIAIIHRTDDDDDKLVVAPPGGTYSDEQIRALTEFQERFFTSVILRRPI